VYDSEDLELLLLHGLAREGFQVRCLSGAAQELTRVRAFMAIAPYE
jgi:hypothetical protein